MNGQHEYTNHTLDWGIRLFVSDSWTAVDDIDVVLLV
jgi:hypothetical protein